MAVGLNRATIYAIKEEVNPGEYLAPTSGANFIPMRPGSELSFEPESLESDELLNDIGKSKSATGKESLSGSYPAYLRTSGVAGQEPQLGLLYESILGTKYVASVEYDTVGSSTVSVIKVDTGEGAQFRVGQALLIKDGSNGYSIRNIASISGDNLTLNFNLDVAPGATILLGKAVTYIPDSQGHPTFSVTKYLGNGFAKEAAAGNTVTECSITTSANGYGEVEFSFQGTKYYYNPVIISATNKFIDFTDDTGTLAISVREGIYKTPIELAEAISAAFDSASVEITTCEYDNDLGKFKIISGSTVFSLLWNTGTNAANSMGPTLGFLVAADDTGSTTYVADNIQSYAAAYTPSYDNADQIIIKGAELMIGDADENYCICAQEISISITKDVEDVDCICEENGIAEKIPVGRTVEMTVSAAVKKGDVSLLDALLKNKSISAMLNCGPKSGGNWVPAKCANFYLGNCTVSNYTIAGDSFIQAEFTLTGFVTSDRKDIYINFV